MFCPSQDLSVWLGLMSSEQLMSPECSKHQVLSFAKYIYIYIYISLKFISPPFSEPSTNIYLFLVVLLCENSAKLVHNY